MGDATRRLAAAGSAALLIATGGCSADSARGSAPRFAPSRPPESSASAAPARPAARRTLHYAPNDNFGPHGRYRPGRFGFTLADVSSPSALSALPPGVRGLVYLGLCGGNTRHFRSLVRSFRPVRRIFGFYLMDVPDPSSCRARHLGAEARYLHRRFAHAVTFVELENFSLSRHPRFGVYTKPRVGIDLFGVAPYPCRTELHGCDLSMIRRYIRAARRAGIERRQIVPVFQAFGGGRWHDDGGGRYQLPTARQARAIICRWHQLLPRPVFDYAYSWGVQRHDTTLATGPAKLRRVFAAHNRGRLRC